MLKEDGCYRAENDGEIPRVDKHEVATATVGDVKRAIGALRALDDAEIVVFQPFIGSIGSKLGRVTFSFDHGVSIALEATKGGNSGHLVINKSTLELDPSTPLSDPTHLSTLAYLHTAAEALRNFRRL